MGPLNKLHVAIFHGTPSDRTQVNAHRNNGQRLLTNLHVPGAVTCSAHIILRPFTTTLSGK